jgi:hypothetical protein
MTATLKSRLKRLEVQTRQAERAIIKIGRLKQLPDDYTGPRHVVDVDRNAARSPNDETFEFEERPGPAPRSCRDDTIRIYVSADDLMV